AVVLLDNLGRSGSAIGALRAAGLIVISIDDPDNPARSDLSINPAFWGCGATVEGFGFTILTGLGGGNSNHYRAHPERADVVASFGGYDPGGFLEMFLEAWLILDTDQQALVAVAGSHGDLEALAQKAADTPNLTLLIDAPLLELLPKARLAVTNGGTTMLMAASLGAPTLAVSQYEHQRDNATRLASLGGAIYLGGVGEVSPSSMAEAMGSLLSDPSKRMQLSGTGRTALPGQGRLATVQHVQLFEHLAWDSDFFGFQVGTLHGGVLTPSILRFALAKCRENNLACMYFLAHGEDQQTLALADGNDFRWVDERLTFIRAHGASELPHDLDLSGIRLATVADSPILGDTAGDAYEFSRYYFDGKFPRDLCHKFYRDWIQKSVTGGFDDVVFVAEVEGQVAGYISCRRASSNLGQIGLVGISKGYRGQGLGAKLLHRALQWFEEEDLPRVEVVTQGRNLPAQKLYRGAGFALERSERWYHKWFASTPNQEQDQ
ncbi:MAG: dTDP-4-amino-4,6-dideoxy-D-galactose acyltransferase, partial [Planctomycetota bacterium]